MGPYSTISILQASSFSMEAKREFLVRTWTYLVPSISKTVLALPPIVWQIGTSFCLCSLKLHDVQEVEHVLCPTWKDTYIPQEDDQ